MKFLVESVNHKCKSMLTRQKFTNLQIGGGSTMLFGERWLKVTSYR